MKGMKNRLKAKDRRSRIYLMIGDVSYIFLTILKTACNVDMNMLNPASIAYTAISNKAVITPTIEDTKADTLEDGVPSSSPLPVNTSNIPDIASAIAPNKVAIIAYP